MKRSLTFLILLCCAACAGPQVQPYAPAALTPSLNVDALVTSDGKHLPIRTWLPATPPKAVVIALHGMNDYSHAFVMPGELMSAQGIAVYAYDQRGFGQAPGIGIWAGEDNLVSDLKDMITVMRERYPRTPLFVLGESMGGAVAIAAFSRSDFPKVDGLMLVAPAVWGGDAMYAFYHASLWTLAHMLPDKILTGEGLHILASDNIPMLRQFTRDPLVQKGTRMDTVLGLVRLMDKGYTNMKTLNMPLLILYGKHDQVIPPQAVAGALEDMSVPHQFAFYPSAYHMMLRDLHRDIPVGDMIGWINDKSQPLPSGSDRNTDEWRTFLRIKLESPEAGASRLTSIRK